MTTKEQQRTEVVSRWLARILTTDETVLLLACSERTAWRLRAAMLRDGAAGLAHGNRGRPSSRRLPDAVADRIVLLATSEYRGFNDTHLAEMLAEEEGIVIGRSSLRRLLRSRGIASPRRRRAARYRSRRERMAQEGLMVQVDGSRHDWLEGRGPWLTLSDRRSADRILYGMSAPLESKRLGARVARRLRGRPVGCASVDFGVASEVGHDRARPVCSSRSPPLPREATSSTD